MEHGRNTDGRLLSPSSSEFRQHLEELDPRIDVNKFLSMARMIASKRFQDLPSDASEVRKAGHKRNVDLEVAATMAHEPETLLNEYYNLYRSDTTPCNDEHHERVLDLERDFAVQFGFDPLEVTPEIDKPSQNGMTPLGALIMLSDDVEGVQRLIEEEGASPVARCGESTPLELAEQLGRTGVAEYLREAVKMMA